MYLTRNLCHLAARGASTLINRKNGLLVKISATESSQTSVVTHRCLQLAVTKFKRVSASSNEFSSKPFDAFVVGKVTSVADFSTSGVAEFLARYNLLKPCTSTR
jgi:hypothetical protein